MLGLLLLELLIVNVQVMALLLLGLMLLTSIVFPPGHSTWRERCIHLCRCLQHASKITNQLPHSSVHLPEERVGGPDCLAAVLLQHVRGRI